MKNLFLFYKILKKKLINTIFLNNLNKLYCFIKIYSYFLKFKDKYFKI